MTNTQPLPENITLLYLLDQRQEVATLVELHKAKVPYIPDYKTRFFAKFKASKPKGRLIHQKQNTNL